MMKRIKQIIYVYEDGTTSAVDIPAYPASPSKGELTVNPYGMCPSCGLKLDSVMGYCCPHPNCPTGLGGVQC